MQINGKYINIEPGANLRGADLHEADLHEANLRWADLHEADLHGADMRGADLCWANLRGADLHEADLHGADIDFAAWPLWCGSQAVKIDERIARQLMAHAFAVCSEFCPPTEEQREFSNGFHRIMSGEFKKL